MLSSYQNLPTAAQLAAIKTNITNSTGPSALGGFIFGGGFSFGMEQAGLDVVGHLEMPDLALGIVPCRNRWPVAVAPLGAPDQPESWMGFVKNLIDLNVKPDVFYANPPCVAYAGPGKHEGSLDDRMCYLRWASYEVGMKLKPTVWCWELVPGVYDHERSLLDAMAFRAKREGYRCYAFLTTSAIHGGYQDRERFHFIASKVELDFDGVYEREPQERRGVHDFGEALALVESARRDAGADSSGQLGILKNDTKVYNGHFQSLMPYCPPGCHLRAVPDEVYKRHYRPNGRDWVEGDGRPGFTHTRTRHDRPCPNILGGHTLLHPDEDRYITPREAATVMGFPMDYEFSPGAKAYAEIGKGLCTHNAAMVGRVIRDGLQRGVGASPKQSTEPEHTNSWMQTVDWRDRAKRLSLKMTQDERNSWWRARHPNEPHPSGVWG